MNHTVQVDTDRIAADLYLEVSLKLRAAEGALEQYAAVTEERDVQIAAQRMEIARLEDELEACRVADEARAAKTAAASAKRAQTRARNQAA